MSFKGRLGLEGARIPQKDRQGVLWLGRGRLYVESGTLRFVTTGFDDLKAGDYAIPFQMLSALLLQPGTTVSHDAFRILARHGTCLVFVGERGVRFYASMPAGPDASLRARKQAMAWADPDLRVYIARRMYAWRLGEVLPARDIAALRGIEGARMKKSYQRLAQAYGVVWRGRKFDRANPLAADLPNQAINHASSAIEAAALVAVAVTGTIPHLGFIHEDPGVALPLDISDLFRDSVLLPAAFEGLKRFEKDPSVTLEGHVRRRAGELIRRDKVVSKMIQRIKDLFDKETFEDPQFRSESPRWA